MKIIDDAVISCQGLAAVKEAGDVNLFNSCDTVEEEPFGV
jgi:hypothetical protein